MHARSLIFAALCGSLMAACTASRPPEIAPEDLTLYFGSRSIALVASEQEKLNRLAMALSESPDVTVTIAGFAGSPGDSERRMSLLAQARILIVREYLVHDLKQAHVEQIRLAYRNCGIGEAPLPHRVDIFITGADTTVTDPCSGERAGAIAPLPTSKI